MKTIRLPLVLLLCAVLAAGLCLAPAATADNQVVFIERSWNGTTVVSSTNRTPPSVTVTPLTSSTSLAGGWYYLKSDVTVNGRVSLQGDTWIILGDGYTYDIKGLYIPAGKTLTIYGQSEDSGRIYSHPSGGAAIGGYSGHDNGNIVINGGTIQAEGYNNCAGIGSNDGRTTGDITIYAGYVTAKGGTNGAGIGGGRESTGGNITIYGGNITTDGGEDGAGIGGGENAAGGTITIWGGTITANANDCEEDNAGIGGGYKGAGGNITINRGTITVYSRDGAGIGGGDEGAGGTITINGGTITSNKVNQGQGARIGGGCDAAVGTIVINGGNVTAKGGSGAGIGGGKRNKGTGSVTINGGTVSTTGSYGIGKGEDGANIAVTLNYTDATLDTFSVTASSFNGTVNLSKAFKNEHSTFEAGTVADTYPLIGTALTPWTEESARITYLDPVNGGEGYRTTYTGILPTTTSLGNGWYVVSGNVVNNNRITVQSGCTANVILKDGARLTAREGITVQGNDRALIIWAQSTGEGAGELIASGSVDSGRAAIGSEEFAATGAITINGGNITAVGGSNGAGIGGGNRSFAGNLTINAGTIYATGGDNAAAIGAGGTKMGMLSGTNKVTIHGGEVFANGGKNAAAIGNGSISGTDIRIDGGQIWAIGHSDGGVGIGSASDQALYQSKVTLSYTDATAADILITATSFNGTVTLSKRFQNQGFLLPPGTVRDNAALRVSTLTSWDGTIPTWADAARALGGCMATGTTFALTQDYTATADDTAFHIPEGQTATIDLKGHTLDRAATWRAQDGQVILNEGTLTVTDSVGGGVLTGGWVSGNGGGIENTGTLTVSNVTIRGNVATGMGGGIYNGGTLTLNSCLITENNATQYGGGVMQDGVMKVSGAPAVRGNNATFGPNIYLPEAHPTMTVSGALTDGADLRVALTKAKGTFTSGYGAKHGTAFPGPYFFSDNTDYIIALENGEAAVADPRTAAVHESDVGRLTLSKTERLGEGEPVTITVLDGTAMSMIGAFYVENGLIKRLPITTATATTATFVMPAADVLVRINPPVDYYDHGKKTYSGNYFVVTESVTNWSSGWYVVNAETTINERIEVQGNVKLVLMGTSDHSTTMLFANQGIHVGPESTLTIYGESKEYGIVSAGGTVQNVPYNSAAIGGDDGEDNGEIIINSGSVAAVTAGMGAGIGGGRNGSGQFITINNGNVMAFSLSSEMYHGGAGIGGGDSLTTDSGQGRNIYITGGSVVAIGANGAGIGGGSHADGYNINISGGNINSSSLDGGAGIGGGWRGLGMDITISGGDVEAYAWSTSGGAGIGAGASYEKNTIMLGASFAIRILGGRVYAHSDPPNAGAGLVESNHSNRYHAYIPLMVADGMKIMCNVDYKDKHPTMVFMPDACFEKEYVLIVPCDHARGTYNFTDNNHTLKCKDCRTNQTSAHTLNNEGVCTVCGYDSHKKYVFFDSDGGTDIDPQVVAEGQKARRPANPEKDGLTFIGWYQVINDETGELAAQPFDFANTTITQSITLMAAWAHEHDGITFQPWGSNAALPSAAGNYYLTQDVRLTSAWTWNSGTLNLCLNGHTVTAKSIYGQDAMTVAGGTVNVYDEKTGTITSDDCTDNLIFVGSGGAFALHGGTIVGPADAGYGVSVSGSFTMTGGAVTGSDRGVLVASGATFTVSGSARVTGNSVINVRMQGNSDRIHVAGSLSESAIFVVDRGSGTAGNGRLTEGLPGNGTADNFACGNSKVVAVHSDGEAYIDDQFTVTLKPGDGTGSNIAISSADSANWGTADDPGKFSTPDNNSATCFLTPDNPFTAPEGKVFTGWARDDGTELFLPGTLIVAGNYSLTAQWADTFAITWGEMPEYAGWLQTQEGEYREGQRISGTLYMDETVYNTQVRLQSLVITGTGIEPITITGSSEDTSFLDGADQIAGGQALYLFAFTMPAADVTVTAVWQELPQAADPVFTPEGGVFTAAPEVVISCETEGAVILYTVDGTEPTAESPVYEEPIPVTGTVLIKACAMGDGLKPSATVQATYTYEPRAVTILPGEAGGTAMPGSEIVISGDDPANWCEIGATEHGKFFIDNDDTIWFSYPDCPYEAPEGYLFTGWKKPDEDRVWAAGLPDTEPVFTLTAQWALRRSVILAAMPEDLAVWMTNVTEAGEGTNVQLYVQVLEDAWNAGVRPAELVVTDSQNNVVAQVTKDYVGNDLINAPGTAAQGTFLVVPAPFTMPGSDVTVTARFVGVFGQAAFTVSDLIAQVRAEAFEGAAVTSVWIPNRCTALGDHAFRNCTSLTKIRIPENCVLGTDVFYGCTKVFVFGKPGSSAETYCATHENCVFVEEQ